MKLLKTRRTSVWVHPAFFWMTMLTAVTSPWFVLVHGFTWKLMAATMLTVAVIILAVNDLMVRAKRRRGWKPIVGVHICPKVQDGESSLAVLWRWTLRRSAG